MNFEDLIKNYNGYGYYFTLLVYYSNLSYRQYEDFHVFLYDDKKLKNTLTKRISEKLGHIIMENGIIDHTLKMPNVIIPEYQVFLYKKSIYDKKEIHVEHLGNIEREYDI